MAAAFPERDDTDSREGTAAHEVAELALTAWLSGGGEFPKIGDIASNGVLITREIYDGAMLFVNECAGEVNKRGGLDALSPGRLHVGIEQQLEAPRVHKLSRGTVDFWLLDYSCPVPELVVIDLKFGWGVVEAHENWQGVNYMTAVIDSRVPVASVETENMPCEFRIVQPRAHHPLGPVRRWRLDGGHLRAYTNVLNHAARQVLGPSPKLQTGAHCRYCEALHACPAAHTAGVQLFEASGRALPEPSTPAQLSRRYAFVRRAHKHLDSLKAALEVELEAVLLGGAKVDEFTLDRTRGSEVWAVDDAEVIALGKTLGVPLDKGAPLTPNQAREKIADAMVEASGGELTRAQAREAAAATVNSYARRNAGKIKIVEHNPNRASEVFS